MKRQLIHSNSVYWIAAVVSSVMAAMIFPANSWFRQGYQPDVILRECIFGFVFTLAVWWYNLVGFPWIANRISGGGGPRLHLVRIGTTLFFSYIIVWIDERLQFLHIDDDLQGYVEREGANEFRAAITASFVLLVIYFLDVLRKFYLAQLENDKLKLETSVAQFELLKQQVNPHFLFNSLNILKSMVKSADPRSEEYVVRLANLYRTLLLSSRNERVSIEEELAALDNYFFMLKARFEDKLELNLQSGLEQSKTFLPPLALQLLVENCIKHNIVSTENPLRIELFIEGKYLVVRNNLQPKRTVEGSNMVGLENLRRRYRMLTHQEIVVEKTGTHFTVKLPLIYN